MTTEGKAVDPVGALMGPGIVVLPVGRVSLPLENVCMHWRYASEPQQQRQLQANGYTVTVRRLGQQNKCQTKDRGKEGMERLYCSLENVVQ